MFKILRYIFLILILLGSINVKANHIVGASIQYECLGGDDYQVYLYVYKNCDQLTPLPPITPVGVTYECSSYLGNYTLALTDVLEVSQICEDSLSQTSCGNALGTFPGVELFVYEGIISIGSSPGEYRIGWNGQGFRSETINLDNTGLNQTLNIYATIIKEDNLCNNSAVLSNQVVPYFCLGQEANFNFTAYDPDQDSLVYSFAPAQQNSGFCSSDLGYESGFSGGAPIVGATINSLTGQINFTPTISPGAYTIVVKIKEYREEIHIGTSFIDVQFIVLLCSNPPPNGSSFGVTNFSGDAELISPHQISMCSGQSFCFDYSFESTVPGAILDVESNLSTLFPSAAISTSGTNPIVVNVCYTAELGDYAGVMVFNASDDNCPVSGISSTAVYVSIITSLNLGDDEVICEGGSAQLTAVGDTLVTWEVLDGDPIVFGSNFSCNNCPNPIATPSETTTYIATGVNLTESCGNTDTITVLVGLEADINFQAETCDEGDGFINIQMTQGSGDYNLDVNTVQLGFDTNNYWELLGIGDGTFNIILTDNISSCEIDTTFTLDPFSVPMANAGDNTTHCGLSFQLAAIPSSGIGTWTNSDSELTINDANNPNSIISVSDFGSYTLTWTEDNGTNCSDNDQVTITFVDAPSIDAGIDDQVCGFTTQLNGNGSVTDGQWQPVPGITFSDMNDPLATITSTSAGNFSFVWEEDSGFGCLVRDTVSIGLIEVPSPNAGVDDQVCSLSKTLEGTPSIGSGIWTGSSDLTFTNVNDPNSNVTSAIEGTYNIQWTETNNTCSETSTVEIIFAQQPLANAGVDTSVCGNQVELNAQPSFGVGEWTVDDFGVSFENNSDSGTESESPSFGSHTYTWTETNSYCSDSDEVTISFIESPIANAGDGDEICGLGDITMNAIPSTGTGVWTFPLELSTIDDSDPNAAFNSSAYGDYSLTWTESDATCYTEDVVTLSFIEQPVANAGGDFNVCGLTASLAAVPSSGIGIWSGSDIDIIADIQDYNSQITANNFGIYNYTWTEVNEICSDFDELVINFLANGIPNAGEDDTTCTDTYSLNATPVAGGVWVGSIQGSDTLISQTDLNNPNATINLPGFGSYTVTWYDPTCDEGDAVTIYYLETPSPDAGSDIINCGLIVEMDATETSWNSLWILPTGLSTIAPNDFDASITASNPGLYTLTLQENNGECVATDEVDVEFIHIPEPDVGPDGFVCGLEYVLAATVDGFNGQWSSSGTLSYLPNANSSTVNSMASDYGIQTIIWTETDATGICTGADSLMVVFNNPPDTANFEIDCFNTNIQYTVSFDIVGGDQDTYVLPGPGTLVGNTFTSSVYDTHDNYSFILNDFYDCDEFIISEDYSCPSLTDAGILNPDTLFICTNEFSDVSFIAPTFVDANDVSLFVIHTGSGTNLGTVLSENYNLPEFAYDNTSFALNNVYYLSSVVGDSLPNGEINYNDVNLSVSLGVPIIFSPPPSLILEETNIIACTDQNAVVDYTLNGSPNWDLTYTFLDDTTQISNISSIQNNITLTDNGTLYFIEIANQFCSVNLIDSVVINIFDNPTLQMMDQVEYCENDEYLVPLTLTGSAPWNILLQNENFQTIDTVIYSSPALIPVDDEGYYYVVNMSDQFCPNSGMIDSTFVDILPTPISLAGEDVEICFGETTLIGEQNEPGLFYEWSNEQWLNSPNISTPTVDIQIDTNVVITYPFVVATSNNICTVYDSVIVTVNPLPFDIELDSISPHCEGAQTMLNVVGPYDFSWSPDQYLSDASINNPITTVDEDFIYTLIAEDVNGCIDSLLVPITVLSRPDVSMVPNVESGCAPLNVEIFNTSIMESGSTCLWTFSENDGFISESCDSVSIIFDEEGDFDVTLRIIDPNGCIGLGNLETPISTSTLTADFEYSPEDPRIEFDWIQLTDITPGAVEWDWTVNEDTLFSTANPLISIDSLGVGIHEICLAVLNEDECADRVCKTLEITDDPLIWVPNAFTPDNDNLNEVFKPVIYGEDQIESYEFSVFNRIGRRIFTTRDMNDSWGNNLIEERKRPIGTYVWTVNLRIRDVEEVISYSGTVLILK